MFLGDKPSAGCVCSVLLRIFRPNVASLLSPMHRHMHGLFFSLPPPTLLLFAFFCFLPTPFPSPLASSTFCCNCGSDFALCSRQRWHNSTWYVTTCSPLFIRTQSPLAQVHIISRAYNNTILFRLQCASMPTRVLYAFPRSHCIFTHSRALQLWLCHC